MAIRNRFFMATAFIVSLAMQAPALTQEATPQDELDCVSTSNFKNIQMTLKNMYQKSQENFVPFCLVLEDLIKESSLHALAAFYTCWMVASLYSTASLAYEYPYCAGTLSIAGMTAFRLFRQD